MDNFTGYNKPIKIAMETTPAPLLPPAQHCRKKFLELEISTFDKVTLSLAGIDSVLLSHDGAYFYLEIIRGVARQRLQFFESAKARAAYDKLTGELNV